MTKKTRFASSGTRFGRTSLGALALVLSLGWLAAVPADAGERYRALRDGERTRARATGVAAAEASLDRGRAASLKGAPRREVLRVSRHRVAKGAPPAVLAEVWVYDYDLDQVSRVVVDPADDSVVSVEVVSGVQLPLTEAEVERALTLVLDDAQVGARVRAAFHRVTGGALPGREALSVSGFVLRADAVPEARGVEDCGVHRCAQLMIRTPDAVALELPIVDLSRSRVLESHRFGANVRPAPPVSDDHGGAHAH